MAGSEHVRWHRSAGLIRPFPPTPNGLHSKISDLVVVDECGTFDLVRGNSLDQAIVPTQATRPNAQAWKVSTAGDRGVDVVARDRRAGRAGGEGRPPRRPGLLRMVLPGRPRPDRPGVVAESTIRPTGGRSAPRPCRPR